jgi:putative FmdB family regulatory protein
MPIYTYRCTECGVQFERNQKFSDAPLTRCPECNKKSLRKVYTPVGIVFKGSGFYATDHHSRSGQTFAPSSKADEKAAEARSSTSSESSSTGDSSTPAPTPKTETAPTAKS